MHIILEKPSQAQEFSFSPFVGWIKYSGVEAGKKEFVQSDLFVQKAVDKIVIDIALALSIFRNSFKVPVINMELIVKVSRKRVWLLSGGSLSKWSHSTSLVA